MSCQLDLDFAGYDQPNANGVFADCEVISMPSKKRSLRAEIRIAFTSAGFLWGSGAMLETEGYGVMPNVSDINRGAVATFKAEAIRKACEEMRRRVGKVQTAGARVVMAWVEGLTA